ncbi:zinc transporter ZIP1-like isoform X2 [Conger conger]|uniref:zinc transporter ZIP1-like isoform X2 n=1 Tax=Conger conger TaxID=82655 RepID=UPI002A5AD956|nr:zinc transporter ZIP1-like isoform X2 [Conger conger]
MNASSDAMSGPVVKLASMAGLLCATLACGIAPLWAVKGSGRCIADSALDWVSCFSGGVFLSSCLLELVPDSLHCLHEAFLSLEIRLQFPLPEFLLSMGFFLVLVMEQIVLAYKDQSRAAKEERWALLMEPRVQSQQGQSPRAGEEPGPGGGSHCDSARLQEDPGPGLAVGPVALVVSLSLHAALEGLVAGLWTDGGWAPGLCASLLLRRCLAAPSLTLHLSRARLRPGLVAGCLLLFSLASPLGVALAGASGPLAAPRLASSTLGGLAAGAFLYVTCLEVLPRQLAAPRNRLPRLALLLAGFTVFTGTLFLKT